MNNIKDYYQAAGFWFMVAGIMFAFFAWIADMVHRLLYNDTPWGITDEQFRAFFQFIYPWMVPEVGNLGKYILSTFLILLLLVILIRPLVFWIYKIQRAPNEIRWSIFAGHA
jgi:hypothetical protein